MSDDEWAFVAPYLTLMREDAPQRTYALREVLNGLRWMVRAGASWRMIPHDLPPWKVVYDQTQRWLAAGVFENLAHDLREVLRCQHRRIAQGRDPQPTAAILDSRTLQSSPESGGRAGYDGAKRRRGNKLHLAVDTLGHLLALCVMVLPSSKSATVRSTWSGFRPSSAAMVADSSRSVAGMVIPFDGGGRWACRSL